MIATAHYLSITQPHGTAQRTWGLVGKLTTSDAQPIHQILCFAIKPQSTGHFSAEKVGFFPILELPHWIEFVVRVVSAAVAPKTPPLFLFILRLVKLRLALGRFAPQETRRG